MHRRRNTANRRWPTRPGSGRAYIDRNLNAVPPCDRACRAGGPYGLSHIGQGLGNTLDSLDRVLIVSLTYAVGVLAVFVIVALARREFEERVGATGLALVGATMVTLVQLVWFLQLPPSNAGAAPGGGSRSPSSFPPSLSRHHTWSCRHPDGRRFATSANRGTDLTRPITSASRINRRASPVG
jgi:hypothetical protein